MLLVVSRSASADAEVVGVDVALGVPAVDEDGYRSRRSGGERHRLLRPATGGRPGAGRRPAADADVGVATLRPPAERVGGVRGQGDGLVALPGLAVGWRDLGRAG